jgi:hypothetical protein
MEAKKKEFRVLGRMLAEEIRVDELKQVSGGIRTKSVPYFLGDDD